MTKTSVPGIFKKGDRYVVVYRYEGKQRKKSCRTMADARRFKAETAADIGRGEFREASREAFGTYARAWVDTYQGRTTRGFRESTRVGYRRTIEQEAIPYFDGRRLTLGQIEPQHIRGFIAHLFAKKPAPAVSTVRGHVAAVRAMLATAAEDGVLRSNPAHGVRISRPGRPAADDAGPTRRAMTRAELARFMAAVPHEHRLMFDLLLQTGVRIGELVELRWRDVDSGTLRVRRRLYRGDVDAPKSRYGKRDIPLSPSVSERLEALRGAADALIFTNAYGEQWQGHTIRNAAIQPARKGSGLDWVGCHTFRHTCASLLFEDGRSIKQVQTWLGHHDPAFTLKTYVHLIHEDGLGDAAFFDTMLPYPLPSEPSHRAADMAKAA